MRKVDANKTDPERVKHENDKNNEWKRENVDRIVIQVNKKYRLADLLAVAVDSGLADNRTQYIIDSVMERLKNDGIL